jgi:hypothetical protein
MRKEPNVCSREELAALETCGERKTKRAEDLL